MRKTSSASMRWRPVKLRSEREMAESNEPRPDETKRETRREADHLAARRGTSRRTPSSATRRSNTRRAMFRSAGCCIVSIAFVLHRGRHLFAWSMRSFASTPRGSPAAGSRSFRWLNIRRTRCRQSHGSEEVDRLAGIARENVYLRLSAKEDQLEPLRRDRGEGIRAYSDPPRHGVARRTPSGPQSSRRPPAKITASSIPARQTRAACFEEHRDDSPRTISPEHILTLIGLSLFLMHSVEQ